MHTGLLECRAEQHFTSKAYLILFVVCADITMLQGIKTPRLTDGLVDSQILDAFGPGSLKRTPSPATPLEDVEDENSGWRFSNVQC